MMATTLITHQERTFQLTAKRAIPEKSQGNHLRSVLEYLAEGCIRELMLQASQCGLNVEEINAMLEATPELSIETRKA